MKREIKTKKQEAELSAKKAIGTLNKVLSMIEEDKYCPEIIQQVDAVIGLLQSTKKNLLAGHLDTCLEERLHNDKKGTIAELLKIFSLGQK
jgi:DNA-binding FrmR family transcriptional regulator